MTSCPATVYAYSTWPKGAPNYWALPAMGDALGWVYRKDWFARPELQAEFKQKYGRDLAPPKTWTELKEVAEFFQGREIDGKKVYGAAIFTERGSEGITMGVTAALYAWGFQYDGPEQALLHGRLRQLAGRGRGARVLQVALQVLHAAGLHRRLHAGRPRRLQVGPGGDADELVRLLPRPRTRTRWSAASISGFFVNPGQKVEASTLGGQGISVVSYSDKKDEALELHQVVRPARRAEEVVDRSAAIPATRRCCSTPNFPSTAPFAADFLKAMSGVKDFWQEPAYAELLLAMQKRMHDYVVADQGTAKEALDLLMEDWKETFEDEGKL